MIASAHSVMSRVSRPQSFGTVEFAEASVCPEGQTEVWNGLFRGSLQDQKAKLSFHDCSDPEEITIIALDLRADGWVVTGLRVGSEHAIEHHIDRISEVEILGSTSAYSVHLDGLPPLA